MKQGSTHRMRLFFGAALLAWLAACDISLPSHPDSFSPRSGGTAVSPSVSGRVRDASNSNPIQGAQILIEDGPGTGSSTTTDAEGAYRITVGRGSTTLRASHNGYESQSRRIMVGSNNAQLNFSLVPVVSGFGT